MLDPQKLESDRKKSVALALQEDIGSGDITAALVDAKTNYHARVITREAATICGVEWVNETFRQLDPTVELLWHFKDGDSACLLYTSDAADDP